MAGALVNGVTQHSPHPFNEALEYEKILKLREDIFAGIHPRLTVPAHALQKVSSPKSGEPPRSQQIIPSALPTVASQTSLQSAKPGNDPKQTATNLGADGVATSAPKSKTTPAVSEIDPVLLTKSDDLVRAELQLQRQRLEKELREQFEKKRLDARKRPAPGEGKPDFDIPATLARALELAKPEYPAKGTSPKDDASATDSFNEDSLYSSRAPDSTIDGEPSSQENSPSQHQRLRTTADDLDADGPAGLRATNVQHFAEAESPTLGAARPTNTLSAVMGPPLPRDDEPPRRNGITATSMDVDDDDEEGEYSPPEALDQYPTPNDPDSRGMQDSRDPRNRPLRRYSELDERAKRPLSPAERNMRIVRNHITTPIAPQPSRVSPLAVAKDPLLQTTRPQRDRRMNGQSPEPPSQNMPPRKKRKLERKAEKRARRNGAASPDVKEEAVSPPPFHEIPALGSARRLAAETIIIEDVPVPPSRYPPVNERYMAPPSPIVRQPVEPPMPLSEPRAVSRSGLRHLRDDQDLRKVASMHNMRIEAPQEYAQSPYPTPSRARAPTYARAESPIREVRHDHDPPIEYERTGTPLRPSRVVSTPASTYRDVYSDGREVRYEPIDMPPPPVERIVVDQYGRRFREIIHERPSAPPRPAPVYRDELPSPTYDPYREQRAGSILVEPRGTRTSSVFVDPPERKYADMPPPVSYRPVAESSRASVVPQSATYDPHGVPSPSGLRLERPTRQPIYVDDRTEFREPVRVASTRPAARYEDLQPSEPIRMASTRPAARYEDLQPSEPIRMASTRPSARYEDIRPTESVVRAASARPLPREQSVFMDDRASVRREYMQVEQPRYRVVEPEPRYVDEQGREIILMDGARDGRQHVVQRY